MRLLPSRLASGLGAGLLALALMGAGPAAPQPGSKPPVVPEVPAAGPCAAAAPLVETSLRQPSKAAREALAAAPLYEAELSLDPEKGLLTGRLRVTVPASWEGPIVLVLPVEGGTSASPFEWSAPRMAVGAGQLAPVAPKVQQGLLIFEGPAGEGPRTVALELQATFPSLGPPGLNDAFLALQPGPIDFELGSLAAHRLGMTLREAYPVLLARGAGPRLAPTPWGAPLPSPPACHLVSVEVPRGHTLRASGLQVGRIPEGEDRLRFAFAAGELRRFSLVALPEERPAVEAKQKGLTLRVSAESEESARRLLGWTRAALASLEAEWGPYPRATLEIATVPLSGAVDGLRGGGLVLVSTVFEGDGDIGALASLQESGGGADLQELTLVHQLAHQWIGEQVATPGPAQPVLEELVASYGLLRHAARRHGAASAEALSDSVLAQLYRAWRMFGAQDDAADRPFEALGLGGWVGLCAGKGSLLLPKAEAAFGPKPVRLAVRRWLAEGRGGVRDRASLEAALVKAVGEKRAPEVRPLFARHLDEAHGDEDLGVADLGALGNFGMLPQGMPMAPFGMGPIDDAALQQMMEEMLRALQGVSP
ncbi:MAG: hypothetical protein P1V51_08035 [Deltaproteobacteria bacterium]|nr:hypothetical protein [Deltaproteobacteria bacterium]